MAENDYLAFAVGPGANVLSQDEYEVAGFLSTGFMAGIADSASLNKVWRQGSTMSAMIGQFIADIANVDVIDDGDVAALLAKFEAALSAYISGSITGGTRPPTVIGGAFAVSAAQNQGALLTTAAVVGTLALTTTLSNGLWFDLWASNGAVTLTPQATDKINNGAVGASFTVPSGIHVLVFTDGAGNWWVFSDILAIANALPQYAVDTGAANAYVATYSPARTTHNTGTPILYFKAAHANTGASTFNPGPGVKALVRPDGTPLRANDVTLNAIIGAVYDGTSYRAISGLSNGFTLVDGVNGYEKFPDGMIHQWGTANLPAGANSQKTLVVNFPIPFPTNLRTLVGNANAVANVSWGPIVVMMTGQNLAGVTIIADSGNSGEDIQNGVGIKWDAWGN